MPHRLYALTGLAVLCLAVVSATTPQADDLAPRPADDPFIGCWQIHPSGSSDPSAFIMFCFGGNAIGTYLAFEHGDGWDGAFGYEPKDGGLRIWFPDASNIEDAGDTCDARFEDANMILSECGREGVYERQCKDVTVADVGAVYCTPPRK